MSGAQNKSARRSGLERSDLVLGSRAALTTMMMPRLLHPSKRKHDEHLMNVDPIEEETGNANSADPCSQGWRRWRVQE